MEGLISLVSGSSKRFRRDDDAVDRFHHRYTAILLTVFAAVSTTQQLVGAPIHCWAPKEFESSWTTYTNTYCWVKNTYFLPFEEDIPKKHEERDEIVYYQWIPFVFIGMAIFFFLPSLVWTSFNSKAGVDSDNILETAENFKRTEKLESKAKQLKLITNQIDRFVGSTPKTVGGVRVKKGSCLSRIFCLCGKKFGNYLVLLYLFTKLLYIGNVVGQLFALNRVLETDFHIFGIQAIRGFMDNQAFLNHTIFPKVTMCDFHVRALGNVRRYTVQCLLPINLYTEKMFVFLWFWMVFLLFLTACNLLMWLVRSVVANDRYSFVENSLVVMDEMRRDSSRDRELCRKFVYDYLRLDGVFVLRMIGDNTNKITSAEIIASVWENWKAKTNNNNHQSTIDQQPDLSSIDTLPMSMMKPIKNRPPKTAAKPTTGLKASSMGPPPPPPSSKPSFMYPPSNSKPPLTPTSPPVDIGNTYT